MSPVRKVGSHCRIRKESRFDCIDIYENDYMCSTNLHGWEVKLWVQILTKPNLKLKLGIRAYTKFNNVHS